MADPLADDRGRGELWEAFWIGIEKPSVPVRGIVVPR
jgi:hypothetical protein